MSLLLPPRFLFMETNKSCNLRCTHCDFWQRDDADKANYLSRQRKSEIVAEFARLSPDGALVICGGEPMLALDEYFAMCADARRAGLRALSVVNGTRIRDMRMASRMVSEGPHEISISLNACEAALHDRTRGVAGAFDKAVRALRLLVAARDAQTGTRARIIVMGLIFKSNQHQIEQFYDLVLNDIGADSLKLNFLQPSFGHDAPSDAFFADEVHVDPDVVMAGIEAADSRFGLGLNPVWKSQVRMYFRSMQGAADLERGWGSATKTEEHICNAYDRDIMVNHYGMARLCFSSQFEGRMLDKVGDLRDFWENAEDIRARMRSCNQFCGISHSVRRESSTLQGVAKAAAFKRAAMARASPFGWVSQIGGRVRQAIGL